MTFKYYYMLTARVYVLSTLIGSLLWASGVYVNGMQMAFSACTCISRNHRRLMAAGTKESHASIPNHEGVATVILLEVKKK